MDTKMFLNEDFNGPLLNRTTMGLNFLAGANLEANVYESSNELTAWPLIEGNLPTKTRDCSRGFCCGCQIACAENLIIDRLCYQDAEHGRSAPSLLHFSSTHQQLKLLGTAGGGKDFPSHGFPDMLEDALSGQVSPLIPTEWDAGLQKTSSPTSEDGQNGTSNSADSDCNPLDTKVWCCTTARLRCAVAALALSHSPYSWHALYRHLEPVQGRASSTLLKRKPMVCGLATERRSRLFGRGRR